MEGRAVAAISALSAGIVQELDASKGAKVLPIDPSPEAMARTRKVGPAFKEMLVKQGTIGVDEDIHTLSFSVTIVARPDLDDTVTKFIDAIWSNHKELPAIHRSLTTWTPDRFASTGAVVPYHPAAIRYYRQKGVWTDELERHQQELARK